MFEAHDSLIILLHLAVAIAHLLVAVYLNDDVFGCVAAISQSIVEIEGKFVLAINHENLGKHRISLHNKVVLAKNNTKETDCHAKI